VALSPTATEITVRQVLEKFDGDFAAVAAAVANGEFALWTGSGISRKAPSLGDLVEKAFDKIREGVVDPATRPAYLKGLHDALKLAEIDPATVEARYGEPLALWPEHDAIVKKLWDNYSRVLDIRISKTKTDFVLWDLIDICKAFEHPAPPAAEHLSIAILILEGAIETIVSANWDGFIEAAVDQLVGGVAGVLKIIVDPDHLRSANGRARLLKFHGCIVHATDAPDNFRQFLTGSFTQIEEWPESPAFEAMRNEVVGVATNQKALVLGLSIQDGNIKALFTKAKKANPWPWPCAPAAPAYVFCEDDIKQGQGDVLKICYGDAYNDNIEDIEKATHLRAWGEQVLIALVLKVVTEKLLLLMRRSLDAVGKSAIAAPLEPVLASLRNDLADLAVTDPGTKSRTAAVNRGIALWSRLLSLYRAGRLPKSPEAYEILTPLRLNLIGVDPNALAMGLGQLGTALSLLQQGRKAGRWSLTGPLSPDITSGAITGRATHPDAVDRPIFFVRSDSEAITLKNQGAFVNDNAIVVRAEASGPSGSDKSARRPKGRYGRDGNVSVTYLSIDRLVARCDDAATLQDAFAADMML